jgi:hypothetical protein
MAEAMPEQKTKISVASENPKRAGIQEVKKFPGVWANKMMNIAMPRKKSNRTSRTRAALVWAAAADGCALDERWVGSASVMAGLYSE